MYVILTKEIRYTLLGKEIVIPKGSEIYIDTASGVGFFEPDHYFDVRPEEYTFLTEMSDALH